MFIHMGSDFKDQSPMKYLVTSLPIVLEMGKV